MKTCDNDLFFTCSLIEYISRITKNKKKDIINKLTKKNIMKIYNLASVYHSENIDSVANSFIDDCKILVGNYDLNNYANIPSHYDIGKVYARLIIKLSKNEKDYVDNLIEVLSSSIIEKMDNYDSSFYYENPDYIYECYINEKTL